MNPQFTWKSMQVGAGESQTFAVPPPPQVWGAVQVPQASRPPHPSARDPQLAPCAAHVVGVQPQTFAVPPPPQVWGAAQSALVWQQPGILVLVQSVVVQMSAVQMSVSAHCAFTSVCMQPLFRSQVSSVHAIPSSTTQSPNRRAASDGFLTLRETQLAEPRPWCRRRWQTVTLLRPRLKVVRPSEDVALA